MGRGKQKKNMTEECNSPTSQNFHFILAQKREHNVTASLQLNYIVIIFILILTLIHEYITDSNS